MSDNAAVIYFLAILATVVTLVSGTCIKTSNEQKLQLIEQGYQQCETYDASKYVWRYEC